MVKVRYLGGTPGGVGLGCEGGGVKARGTIAGLMRRVERSAF